MKIINYKNLAKNCENCCINTTVRRVPKTSETKGWDINLFEMQPGGYSPLHNHPEQHLAIIIEGEGTITDGKKIKAIHNDNAVFIKANEPHQFKTVGETQLRFIVATF